MYGYKKKFDLPSQKEIVNYLDNVEITGYYKFYGNKIKISAWDQKCTYDILNVLCKCINNFWSIKNKDSFTINDFLKDDFCREILKEKTSHNGKAVIRSGTYNEYDKLFGNLLETLSYCNVLEKNKIKNSRVFKIKNFRIIEVLKNDDLACLAFVCHFVYLLIRHDDKVMKSIKLLDSDKYNQNYKKNFKDSTIEWIQNNSKRSSYYESKNISQKINNPIFYLYEFPKYNHNKYNKEEMQGLYDLAYFRVHRRDKNKPKQKLYTRPEWNNDLSRCVEYDNEEKNKIITKDLNKRFFAIEKDIKKYFSEYNFPENQKQLDSCHVHHIWPISYWNPEEKQNEINPNMLENLIILDQTEHYNFAHKNNDTKTINLDKLNQILWSQYRKICSYIEKDINQLSLDKFYKLCCRIYGYDPEPHENKKEKICKYIEEIISTDIRSIYC